MIYLTIQADSVRKSLFDSAFFDSTLNYIPSCYGFSPRSQRKGCTHIRAPAVDVCASVRRNVWVLS